MKSRLIIKKNVTKTAAQEEHQGADSGRERETETEMTANIKSRLTKKSAVGGLVHNEMLQVSRSPADEL